jgi:sulfite reductase (ferredoxin)
MSPKGACGDVVRNVTGCPLAGVAADELIDASPVALAISDELKANPLFYNLPRKFKICATGCPSWCSYPEINDVALTAAKYNGEVGFSLRVGGGLSNEPISRFVSMLLPCRIKQSASPRLSQRSFAINKGCARAAIARGSSTSS